MKYVISWIKLLTFLALFSSYGVQDVTGKLEKRSNTNDNKSNSLDLFSFHAVDCKDRADYVEKSYDDNGDEIIKNEDCEKIQYLEPKIRKDFDSDFINEKQNIVAKTESFHNNFKKNFAPNILKKRKSSNAILQSNVKNFNQTKTNETLTERKSKLFCSTGERATKARLPEDSSDLNPRTKNPFPCTGMWCTLTPIKCSPVLDNDICFCKTTLIVDEYQEGSTSGTTDSQNNPSKYGTSRPQYEPPKQKPDYDPVHQKNTQSDPSQQKYPQSDPLQKKYPQSDPSQQKCPQSDPHQQKCPQHDPSLKIPSEFNSLQTNPPEQIYQEPLYSTTNQVSLKEI